MVLPDSRDIRQYLVALADGHEQARLVPLGIPPAAGPLTPCWCRRRRPFCRRSGPSRARPR
ncbi:hypothetical protein MBH78_05625 [Oceanimonas sp. NS1]|nr:hypothetical protein [Oceanimonas sp. NS1]